MTIQGLLSVLKELDRLKCKGGKTFKDIQKALAKEATTHNMLEIKELLAQLKDK
jgi:hypothetical protein